MAELLYLFHEIEKLMIVNGAKETNDKGNPTSFEEKVNSFDAFDFEPKNPGNVGYKFYVQEDKYYIKEPYKYDVNIKEQLDVYEKYKSHERRYLENRATILGGNYYVLRKIVHERNKLLYVENYEIEDHNAFVKDCRSMMKYLQNPDKKPFLTYGKFTYSARDTLKKLKAQNVEVGIFEGSIGSLLVKSILFLSILTAIVLILRYINSQNIPSVDSNIGRYIWGGIFATIGLYFLVKLFKFVTNEWVLRSFLLLGSMLGFGYLNNNGFIPVDYTLEHLSLGEYIVGGAALVLMVYTLPSIITNIFQSLHYFFLDFFTGIFSMFFSKNSLGNVSMSIIPYIFGFWFVIYLMLQGDRTQQNYLSTKSKKVVHTKCQYFYVKVDILHVRDKATDKSHIVDKVYKNEKLCITQKKSHWYYVKHRGWVFLKHLNKQDITLDETLY